MVNKVILIGTVSSDPGFSYGIESEEAVFALKTNVCKRRITRMEEVQWHRIVLMGHFTELGKKIRMNDVVYVEGVLSTTFSKRDQDGEDMVFNSEVVATDIRLLSKSMPSSPGRNLAAALIDKIKKRA